MHLQQNLYPTLPPSLFLNRAKLLYAVCFRFNRGATENEWGKVCKPRRKWGHGWLQLDRKFWCVVALFNSIVRDLEWLLMSSHCPFFFVLFILVYLHSEHNMKAQVLSDFVHLLPGNFTKKRSMVSSSECNNQHAKYLRNEKTTYGYLHFKLHP